MEMSEFLSMLQGAIAGNHDALEMLLKVYEPLINKYSHIGGQYDEDLKQYISMHIALNISKFIIF